MARTLALTTALCAPLAAPIHAQTELFCPDPELVLARGVAALFEDIQNTWHVFPAETAYAIFAELDESDVDGRIMRRGLQ